MSPFSTRLIVGRIQERLSQTKATSLQHERHTAAARRVLVALSCFLLYLDVVEGGNPRVERVVVHFCLGPVESSNSSESNGNIGIEITSSSLMEAKHTRMLRALNAKHKWLRLLQHVFILSVCK